MKSYEIYLIRHGITDGNLKGLYVGSTDSPLCEAGIARLEGMSKKFEYPAGGAYFTSPLLRCRQTSSILYPQANWIEIPDFRECAFGEWEGKSGEELSGNPLFEEWLKGDGTVCPPGGESGEVFIRRVNSAFEKVVESLLRTGITKSVIVAHGGTIMAILSTYGLPKANFYDWIVENGHGYSIRITPRLWMTDKVFEVYNELPTTNRA